MLGLAEIGTRNLGMAKEFAAITVDSKCEAISLSIAAFVLADRRIASKSSQLANHRIYREF
jgi:hypothetical protein